MKNIFLILILFFGSILSSEGCRRRPRSRDNSPDHMVEVAYDIPDINLGQDSNPINPKKSRHRSSNLVSRCWYGAKRVVRACYRGTSKCCKDLGKKDS